MLDPSAKNPSMVYSHLTPPAFRSAHKPRRAAGAVVGTRLQRHRGTHVICPHGRARARGVLPRFHELGVRRSPEILLDQIAGATLRQPRGQRPRLRRHPLPAAVLRGGGGVRGGEMVMEPLRGSAEHRGEPHRATDIEPLTGFMGMTERTHRHPRRETHIRGNGSGE